VKRLLAQTIAIQGLGVIVMFAVTLYVARVGGTTSQGSFAFVKSVTDLQVAIFSLGLPSAIIFMLNKRGTGHQAVFRKSLAYGATLSVILPIFTFAALKMVMNSEINTNVALQALTIGLAGAWLTLFALLRALLLVYSDGAIFSMLSILQWIIIGFSALTLLNRTPYVFEVAYCLAGAISLLAIIGYLHCTMYLGHKIDAASDAIDWRMLRQQSVHVMLQTSFFALQPFLTNAALAQTTDGLASIGLFNIASMVVALPNLLVALVAPVLFNRWSKSLDWSGIAAIRRNSLYLGAAVQIVAILSMPMVAPVIILLFGSAFVDATVATYILLLAILPIVTGRIITPAVQGLGRTDYLTRNSALRLTVSIATAALLICAGQPPLMTMAIAWCVGEYVALFDLLRFVSHSLTRFPGA
jgi:O-antigen/teichoic acid export membrane protein